MARIKSVAAWLTFPVIFTAQLVGFANALRLAFDPGLTLLAVAVANMTLIALLELWLPDRPDWRWTNDGQLFNDVIHGLGNEFAGGLGAPAPVMIWIAALMTFLGSLNHSNLRQELPRFIHMLVATQQTHWLQHYKGYSRGSCNLSPLTMWLDHLCGTFRHPLDNPLHEVGIAPDPIPKNLLAQLISPLLWPLLMRSLRRGQKTPPPPFPNSRT